MKRMKSLQARPQKREQLIRARAKKHWTLAEMAEHLQVDVNTISRWERNIATPRASHVQLLCEVFGATAEDLGIAAKPLTEVAHPPLVAPLAQREREQADGLVIALLHQDVSLRLFKIVWFWPHHNTCYAELQWLIMQETEENNTMPATPDDALSRRDAFRRYLILHSDAWTSGIFARILLGFTPVAILYNRTNRAAIDADSCATHIISDRALQIGYCCGDLLWPTETAHVIWSYGLRSVAFHFLPRLAPTMSLCHVGERCPSCLARKDRAGSHDV